MRDLVQGADIKVKETGRYGLVIGETRAISTTENVRLDLPLFDGARLQACQSLCDDSPPSPLIEVRDPYGWVLKRGPFNAGFRNIGYIPVDVTDYCLRDSQTKEIRRHPVTGKILLEDGINPPIYTGHPPSWYNTGVAYYPALADAENAEFAQGGPFPLIVYGHGFRSDDDAYPGWRHNPEPSEDCHQLSGILEFLATWGFVSISPDLSWMFRAGHWQREFGLGTTLLDDAISYMLRSNTSFSRRIIPTKIGVMGHSRGGLGAMYLGASGTRPIRAMALIAPADIDPNAMPRPQMSSFAPNPVLVLHGEAEESGYSTASSWRGVGSQPLEIYRRISVPKYLVRIQGANHFGYTDSIRLSYEADVGASIRREDQQKIAKAYITTFFCGILQTLCIRTSTNTSGVSDRLGAWNV